MPYLYPFGDRLVDIVAFLWLLLGQPSSQISCDRPKCHAIGAHISSDKTRKCTLQTMRACCAFDEAVWGRNRHLKPLLASHRGNHYGLLLRSGRLSSLPPLLWDWVSYIKLYVVQLVVWSEFRIGLQDWALV